MKYVLVFTGKVSKNEVASFLELHHLKIEKEEAYSLTLSTSNLNADKARQDLMQFSATHKQDMALITETLFRTPKKLVVFDMDSTLIQAEVIDELARAHGIGHKVKLITERAMNGEINFDQSLRERAALLKGFDKKKMEEVYHAIQLTPGVEKFIQVLQSKGIKTAIVSGGFNYFARKFQSRLKMDFAFANELEAIGDLLTGNIAGEILNAEKKASILMTLAQDAHLQSDEVVAIGDGANDLPMLASAGLGIAFHAKEKVRQQASHHIDYGPMDSILHYLGIHE